MSDDKSIVVANMGEAFALAQRAATSGMFGMRSPEQALMCLLRGIELGFGPATSLSAFHVISGKPCLSADAQVAVCKSRRDVCKYFVLVSSDATQATYETHRIGDPKPVAMSFTMEDAKLAKLLGKSDSAWSTYPKTMLRHRAASALAREVYPELLMGIYDPDELGGESAPRNERVSAEITSTHETAHETALDTDAAVSDWTAKIRAAQSIEALRECGREIKTLPESIRARLRPLVDARKGELQPPKPPSGGAPKPGASAAVEAIAERQPGDDESEDPRPANHAADIVRDAAAWAAHLANEDNEFAVAFSLLKHEGAFRIACVDKERRAQAERELTSRGIDGAAAFIANAAAKRARSA